MPSWKEKHGKIQTTKLLVVGAGGIGCELLKNLAATGFQNVHVIDLDTIDISNLNRQFLFRKEHVSSSKAEIATKVVKQFCPSINLGFDHASIFEEEFNVEFFKKFDMVLNALDNKKARNHVNRMCHAANKPLIESGSSGYFGQVQVIMRGKTECYECQEKPASQKTFPGCTIRNTPSEHIHCTVWAKHVFNQLFGEVDIDDDVSPDMEAEDTENPNETGNSQDDEAAEEPAPIGTRKWAESVNFDAAKVFDKLFFQDIQYLVKMDHLWKQRKPPTPLSFAVATTTGESLSFADAQNKDTSIWSIATCANVFAGCVRELLKEIKLNPDVTLSFDKDHPIIMAFVAACANVRAHLFSIHTKTMFEIKAMAGNIIPAIASTNAIVAGMIVTEAVKMIDGNADVKSSFIRNQPNPRGKIFLEGAPYPPNPKCYVCSETREVFIYVNPAEMTVGALRDKVLMQELNMLQPDVMDTNTANVVLSSDGDTDSLLPKKLSEISIEDGAILTCDDFMQDMVLKLFIRRANHLRGDNFEIARSDKEKDEEEARKKEQEKHRLEEAENKEKLETDHKSEEEERRKRKVDEKESSEEPDVKRTKVEEKTGGEENENKILAME
ncbi:hypothetical protein GCK72_002062 [Caenorhabditis remanei]|uniref:SUMO-activating enzyme subunit n=1 Tax=Caenorhabditis remanei TaxID=31234 RepID=A0A6A5HUC7_CAERE|nr:hypothetical protein GCK72_002062 [Caenorhabditis remanei]KAF1770244.1 hypothetical protein GCK72_002062 [Caenorhabditis remanei]